MNNPILQNLNGSGANNMIGRLNGINQMLSGKNPSALYDQLMRTNPRFSQFVNENKGRTPDQIAQAYGIDPALIRPFLK